MRKIPDLSALLRAARAHAATPGSHNVAGSISETIHRALSAAGLDASAGSPYSVADTIRRALSGAGLDGSRIGTDIDAAAVRREVDVTPEHNGDGLAGVIGSAEDVRPGQFASRSFTSRAGTRTYKLYVPATYTSRQSGPMPMVVMLHGCTQSPDDFAAGTRMNELAEEHGFIVVYPAQAAHANASKCWNWFRSEDQGRDGGEPALIAGIVREVSSSYRVDERRIFVAGLSAGAAMAVILGATYPELFAAVCAHSGLPYGAAHDMPSAFVAMQGAQSIAGLPTGGQVGAVRYTRAAGKVPTIVFHGDTDFTVHGRNGAAIVEQATAGLSDERQLRASIHDGETGAGRTYRRTVYTDASGQAVVEDWVLHGAGHAWSGGSTSGTFTDPAGPDASAEMVRFFYSQRRAGTA